MKMEILLEPTSNKLLVGYLKDGDGDGNSHYERPHKGVKASANSDIVYFFTSAQDGYPLQDDCLPHLKVLQLETFKELLSTPDFEGLPCLQELVLYECTKLEEIHPLLGNHKSLKHVTVSCRNLKKFPTIDNMKKLETLCIHCDIVIEIPKIQSNMENLVTLSLGGSGTQRFLSSVAVRCPNLISLRVTHFCTLISIDFNVNWLRILKHNLRKLNLYDCRFNDGEIPSEIGDLSNLQELDLSSNYFLKLDFSLSQLTQLVLLNVSDCNFLETLPELPSSIVIFAANRCDRLVDIGDFHTNYTWLCQVAVMYGNILNVGDRLLQSMLQGKAIENHSMVLLLQGFPIPREYQPRLRDGTECTLQLPENWSNDFCGFLLCVVLTDDFKINSSPDITMEQVTGGLMVEMDSQDDVDWEESVDDKITWVGYVSFDSLRHTAWWDETYRAVLGRNPIWVILIRRPKMAVKSGYRKTV
ncbi:Toll/interleukin-1 receptor domain-containing protein [Tanacetum coccineum]